MTTPPLDGRSIAVETIEIRTPDDEERRAKNEKTRAQVERFYRGPRLEMFARTPRPGWDAWGDQAEGGIALPALEEVPA